MQTTRNGRPCLKLLGGAVTARLAAEHRLTVEWSSSAMNDMVADSVLAFAAQAECSPLSLRGARCSLPACAFIGRQLTVPPDSRAVTSMKHEHTGEHGSAGAAPAPKTE